MKKLGMIEFRYADGMVLIAKIEKTLNKNLGIQKNALKKKNMKPKRR